jgi:hypothetical protein
MNTIGFKSFVQLGSDEFGNIVSQYIRDSANIRNAILSGADMDLCMIGLIKDTYMCNLLLRYIGYASLCSNDSKWDAIDSHMIGFVHNYYQNSRFRKKLIVMYEHYLKTYEAHKKNYDYCKFLDKLIIRCESAEQCKDIKKVIKMTENRIFNLLGVNPIVRIATRHLSRVPAHYEVIQDKANICLTQSNYLELIDLIDGIETRHMIESSYISRTNGVMNDFAKLILHRHHMAVKSKHTTYYKHINHTKHDNSEAICELITELNKKIDRKAHTEVKKIHQYFYEIDGKAHKLSRCDITKYCAVHKNTTRFDLSDVIKTIFHIIEVHFGILFNKQPTQHRTIETYQIVCKSTARPYGIVYMDRVPSENKKNTTPISVRLSDKMQINRAYKSECEIALIVNYKQNKLVYDEVILLFREFGYILGCSLYDSRVGMVNYDDEFANYVPLVMEHFAWDTQTISMLVATLGARAGAGAGTCASSGTSQLTVDHIEQGRYMDMCYNLKLKCVNARFDHLLHNSEPHMEQLEQMVQTTGNGVDLIVTMYKNTYMEMFKPLGDLVNLDILAIDPIVIINEINNLQGVGYANLMNEIFAYATYWIIREKKATDFKDIVLTNGTDNYRELIRTFLKKINVNYFDLYVKNVIRTSAIADYVTEDTNYFDDNEHDSESDKEDVIQIKRI